MYDILDDCWEYIYITNKVSVKKTSDTFTFIIPFRKQSCIYIYTRPELGHHVGLFVDGLAPYSASQPAGNNVHYKKFLSVINE